MPPPAAMAASSAALRVGASALVCGGALPLVGALLSRRQHAEEQADAFASPLASHSTTLFVGAAALCYLGSLRANITHQGRRRLALQTCALGVPMVVLARVGGYILQAQLAMGA